MPRNGVNLRDYLLSRVHRADGCWLWRGATTWTPSVPGRRYGYVVLKGRRLSARRLMYELFVGEPKLGRHCVVSTCGNSLCVKPDHLKRADFLGSTGPNVKGSKHACDH